MDPRKHSLKFHARCNSRTWRTVPCPQASIGSQQRGLALITAMLVIAISVTAVTYMAFNQSVWIHQGKNLIDRTQADAVAYRYIQAAMDSVSVVAIENKKKGILHDDDQAGWNRWGKSTEGFVDKDLEALGGELTAKITDAQAKFNLNNILDWQKNPPTDNAADINTLQQILIKLDPNFNRDLINAMIDWIDPNSDVRPNSGAEDIDYTNVAPPRIPYRAANQAFTSVGELGLVQGFNAKIAAELIQSKMVTALPTKMSGAATPTPVNVNTASDDVLLALFPILTTSTVTTFTGARPYKTVDEVKTKLASLATSPAPPTSGQQNIPNYGVTTSYFEVEVTVKIGKVERHVVALIYRPTTPARPQIVQISYPVVEAKAEKESDSAAEEAKSAFEENESDEGDQ
jgi:general secretion pathway protein K